MTPLLEAIYRYIMENELSYYLDKSEYEESSRHSNVHEKALKEMLNEEQRTRFEDYIDAFATLECVQAEAIFCAALSVGLSLGALHRP